MGYLGQYVLPHSIWTPGQEMVPEVAAAVSAAASRTCLATNAALYLPLYLPVQATIQQIAVFNGATVAGNVDVGIYDYTGARLVSSAPQAQAGVNAVQFYSLTPTLIGPGRLYVGLAVSDGTATFFTNAIGATLLEASGVQAQTGLSSGTLPNPAAFVASVTANLPLLGVIFGRVV